MRDIATAEPDRDFVVEVLLDRPPVVSAVHLRWRDGRETYAGRHRQRRARERARRGSGADPERRRSLLDSTQDVKHSPLGVLASIRTYGTL